MVPFDKKRKSLHKRLLPFVKLHCQQRKSGTVVVNITKCQQISE